MELIMFDIIMLLLIKIDMYKYDNQIVPLAIVGTIYTVLINFNNIVATKIYGFKEINSYTLYILLIFFTMIFAIDYFFGKIYQHIIKKDFNENIPFANYRLLFSLFAIGVSAYLLQFVRLYRINGLDIKGRNNGILGHICSFAFILGPVVLDLAIKSKKKIRVMMAVVMNITVIIISILFGGKYVILINTTYLLLYFILKRNMKTTVKSMIKVAIPLCTITLLLFIVLYYFIPIITGQYQSSIYFAVQHMFYYLLGPILGNNYALSHMGKGSPLIPYTVGINIFKALLGKGDYISPLKPFIFQVSDTELVNVSGLIGEVAYDIGLKNSLIYIGVIFIIINTLLLIYRCYNKCYLSMVYLFAILVFSFFCNFFTVSGVVLPLLLAFMIDIFSILMKSKS